MLYVTDETPPGQYHTCPHPYHSNYDEKNLPPLLFRMDEPPQPAVLPELGVLVENGEEVKDDEGHPIRNFSFLPRYISMNPPGWLLEYWMRTDERLTYKDILARMTGPVADRPKENTLNMRRQREVREPLALSGWDTPQGKITRVDLERVERWTPDQIRHNTTMLIEYYNGQPVHLKAKTQDGEAHYCPLITFLNVRDHEGYFQLHNPSNRVLKAVELFENLSNKARELGLQSWHSLPEEHLPERWKPKENDLVQIYAGDYFPGHIQAQPAGSFPIMHYGYNEHGFDDPAGVVLQQPAAEALYPIPPEPEPEPEPETKEQVVEQTISNGRSTGPVNEAAGSERIGLSFPNKNKRGRDKTRKSTTKNKQDKGRIAKKKKPRNGKQISGNGNAAARGGNSKGASDTVGQPGSPNINLVTDNDSYNEGQGEEEDTDMDRDESHD